MDESRDTQPRKMAAIKGIIERFPGSLIRRFMIIVVLGAIVGTQIASPKKRVIEAAVGGGILLVLWNFSTFAALSFIILMYPFPFGTSIGSSNFIITMSIFIIYMIRVSAQIETIRSEKFFNLPIILLVLSYIFSFYHFEYTPIAVNMAFIHTFNFFAAIIFFYMIINFVDSEKKLKTIVRIMMITALLVIAFTIFEMRFPGTTLVPGWLHTKHKTALVMKDIRMGGPFMDFELFAEFCAMNAPIIFLMLLRARRLLVRYLYAILLLADLFMMLTTMTRGAFISLSIGVLYLALLSRKDLNIVRVAVIFVFLISVVVIMENVIAKYTVSGSLFDRLIKTTFSRGLIPDTRSEAWFIAWDRAMNHPIVGHGPGWDFTKGIVREAWPHSGYLYILNITGFFGLISFLFLLVQLLRASMPGIKSSLVSSPFPNALMKVLHVCLVMFIVDQIKIEYLRNITYVFYVWLFFGVIAATRNIILKCEREQSASIPST